MLFSRRMSAYETEAYFWDISFWNILNDARKSKIISTITLGNHNDRPKILKMLKMGKSVIFWASLWKTLALTINNKSCNFPLIVIVNDNPDNYYLDDVVWDIRGVFHLTDIIDDGQPLPFVAIDIEVITTDDNVFVVWRNANSKKSIFVVLTFFQCYIWCGQFERSCCQVPFVVHLKISGIRRLWIFLGKNSWDLNRFDRANISW